MIFITYMDTKDELIQSLVSSNCIKIGKFDLKCGDTSKYYFDMKNLISYPELLKKIGDEIYEKLKQIDFDIICGIPYGGLPIASYISTTYGKPMIFVRDKAKEYGTQKQIEGEYKQSDKCVIIDDVITSGSSVQQCVDVIESEVNIVNIMVIFNRQQHIILNRPFQYLLCKNDVVRYRLKQISTQKNSKLCFSADIQDTEKIIRILNDIGKHIVVCKIHYDIMNDFENSFKNQLIDLSIQYDFLIMEDRKFNDISYIVEKQYARFSNWVDMVTVHSLVSPEVISKLSGAFIVVNMSNNTYDFTNEGLFLCKENPNNVLGFITQKRIKHDELPHLICMTPGVSHKTTSISDQTYRSMSDIDADFFIVGRALYNSENIKEDILHYVS